MLVENVTFPWNELRLCRFRVVVELVPGAWTMLVVGVVRLKSVTVSVSWIVCQRAPSFAVMVMV